MEGIREKQVEMIPTVLLVIGSMALLYLGAESLVRGSASMARRAGMSALSVGLTIVAFGTSFPELVVSSGASLAGRSGISLGNAIGSNIFNIGIILGLSALVCPLPVHHLVIRRDAPVVLAVSTALLLMLENGRLGRLESLLLLSGLPVYAHLNIRAARRGGAGTGERSHAAPAAGSGALADLLFVLAGLALLPLGAWFFIENTVRLARMIGISDELIGLTIVSAGTSLPELATSVVAAIRRQPDIAIGNIMGSNVFNVLGVLGVSGVLSPLETSGDMIRDCRIMIAFTLLMIPLLYTGRKLHRAEGLALLAGYAVYIAWRLTASRL